MRPLTLNQKAEAESIMAEVCALPAFAGKVNIADLKEKDRTWEIALARHIVMWLFLNRARISKTRIGELLGNRRHATVIHGARRIDKLIEAEPHWRGIIRKLENSSRTPQCAVDGSSQG